MKKIYTLEALGIGDSETSENYRAIKISASLLQPNSTLKPPLPSTVRLYKQRHAVNHSQTWNTQSEREGQKGSTFKILQLAPIEMTLIVQYHY